jgi:hypothetical protein
MKIWQVFSVVSNSFLSILMLFLSNFNQQLYDQHSSCGRKTLLTKSQMHGNAQMVETEPFDIYLCDNCDAELYSFEAYKVS